MKKNNLYKLGNTIKIVLEIFTIISILVLLLLYPITKGLKIHYDLFIMCIYPCGLCFIYLIYQFICLFDTLKNNNPFCFENVDRFKNSMYSSIIMSILIICAFLVSVFVYNYYSLQLKVALLVISFLFICFSVCFYVLSLLFKKEDIYKEENDLTI